MARSTDALTRRDVIIGAGAAAAGLGATALGAAEAGAVQSWDREADVVVVGSGVGGCAAAVTARELGNSVVVLEKAPFLGGTSKKSAGVLWIPDNFTLRAKGISDRKEDCLQYLARYSYPERYVAGRPNLGLTAHEYSLLEVFYDNASKAVDHLRETGALRVAEWRMFALDRPATDYLDQVPENKVPTGRPLGPLKQDGTMGLGVDLMAQFEAALQARQVPVLTGHAATRLVMDGAGRVIGVEARAGESRVAVRARKGVIFASGGFVHNVEFSDTYMRQRMYGSCAMPSATGDFVRIATAAGARLGNMTGSWGTQVVLDEALRNRVLAQGVFFPPGDSMLQVNRYGRRVVNEKRNYNDRTAVHGYFDPSQADYPNELMFMIYDQRTAESFAGAYPLPADGPTASRYVLTGDTLEILSDRAADRLRDVAPQTGGFSLDPAFAANLKQSIARFNGFARVGRDDDFSRGAAGYDREWQLVFSPMNPASKHASAKAPNVTMYPLSDKGPYYAVILAAGCLDTCGGPVIDSQARVLDSQDRPIPGLYGAGNCIASPSRFAYWGAGHTLGQSLTFGYIAANAANAASPAPA
jgi:3-oxosteroid 1-dehydrogenase